jgi:mannosyl-3-phosphoglycerate phosphatase
MEKDTVQSYLIFTDLDGTLLDHNNYTFDEALPALDRINQYQIPLILNSSKTQSEIISIRQDLQNNHPFVVENGAAVLIPGDIFTEYTDPVTEVLLGASRTDILQFIHQLRDQRGYTFKGFADFTLEEIMAETGLSKQQAEQAKDRSGSEPIKWLDSGKNLLLFKKIVEQQNLKLLRGGRFLHVMGQTDKAQAMSFLVELYRKQYHHDFTTIALGDSQNDQLMLEKADIAGVIRPGYGEPLKLKQTSNIVLKSTLPEPKGWQEVMTRIFNLIDI